MTPACQPQSELDFDAIAADTLKWAGRFVKTPAVDVPFIGKRESSREHDYYLDHYSSRLDVDYGGKGSVLWRRACEGLWTLSVLKRYCADVRKWKSGDWDKLTEGWFPAFALLELGHIVNYRRRVEAGLIAPVTDEIEAVKPVKKAASRKKKADAQSEPWTRSEFAELSLS